MAYIWLTANKQLIYGQCAKWICLLMDRCAAATDAAATGMGTGYVIILRSGLRHWGRAKHVESILGNYSYKEQHFIKNALLKPELVLKMDCWNRNWYSWTWNGGLYECRKCIVETGTAKRVAGVDSNISEIVIRPTAIVFLFICVKVQASDGGVVVCASVEFQ